MDTLKSTTLTLLIPFGWIMSEAAAAYPEQPQQIDALGDHNRTMGCVATMVELPKIGELKAMEPKRPDPMAIQVTSGEATTHLQGRDSYSDTCRMDLDLIEID